MAFKIYFVYHSHIDIGYTERQEKITQYHTDFIKQAVDCCLSYAQKKRGQDSRFTFTAEGFFAVEEYLKRYGDEGKKKLLKAIESGQFELTAFYFHLADLLSYENLRHTLSYTYNFVKENHLAPVEVAMSADVNGFSWGMSQALYDSGVKYLTTCINTHHGGAPFGKPLVPFWWETPNGNKLLVWNGLTYHKANLLGMIAGLTPVADPGVPGMTVTDTGFVDVKSVDDLAKKRIFSMVEGLRGIGYDKDYMLMMGSGLYTDNSPLDDGHCALVEEWNQKYGGEIEIVTTTLTDFFKHLEKVETNLPVYCGDWNDWWTDGALSTPSELRLFRNAQRLQTTVSKLDPDAKVVTDEERRDISKNLMMYAEHTWGHSASYSDPTKLLVKQLDFRKTKYAVDADILASKAFDKVSLAMGEGEFTTRKPFEYIVVNPNPYAMKGLANISTDFWEEGRFSDGKFYITDSEGTIVPHQRTYTLRGAIIVCALLLQPHERKTLKIVFGTPPATTQKTKPYYTYQIQDNQLKSILLDGKTQLLNTQEGLGAPLYQVFQGGQRSDAAGFGYSKRKKPAMQIFKGEPISCKNTESGEVFTRLCIDYKLESCKYFRTIVTLYNTLPRIDVEAEFAKDLVVDPEGLYISLPFCLNGGKWQLDKAGALLPLGKQLPKCCCDYFTVYRGAVLKNAHTKIAVNTLDTPLVTFEGIKLWDFTDQVNDGKQMYSWVLNNKWETNFRSECSGFYQSRYVVSLDQEKSDLQLLEMGDNDFLTLRK